MEKVEGSFVYEKLKDLKGEGLPAPETLTWPRLKASISWAQEAQQAKLPPMEGLHWPHYEGLPCFTGFASETLLPLPSYWPTCTHKDDKR